MRARLATIFVASLAPTFSAVAAEDTALSARLTGNSLIVTQHNQLGGLVAVSRVYLSTDRNYISDNTVGQTSKGTWRATETELCLTATDPLPPPKFRKENCLSVAGQDQWQITSRQGGTLRYDIRQGRSTEPMRPVLPNVRYPDLNAR